MTTVELQKNEERRKRVYVGMLPVDFLRLPSPANASLRERQEAADSQAALSLYHSQISGIPYPPPSSGRLTITVVQAKLVKNYGMTRMDPYVRIRVGHNIYETVTDSNAGKTPKWNREIQCLLPQGISTLYVEIFDECSFFMDELIAWAQITIPESVLKGEAHENWFPLSGKQGEGVEGMINLVLSYTPLTMPNFQPIAYNTGFAAASPILGVPILRAPVAVESCAPAIPPPIRPSPQDLQQIEEMFPTIDKEVIGAVYEANHYVKDTTVNSLLQMTNT